MNRYLSFLAIHNEPRGAFVSLLPCCADSHIVAKRWAVNVRVCMTRDSHIPFAVCGENMLGARICFIADLKHSGHGVRTGDVLLNDTEPFVQIVLRASVRGRNLGIRVSNCEWVEERAPTGALARRINPLPV